MSLIKKKKTTNIKGAYGAVYTLNIIKKKCLKWHSLVASSSRIIINECGRGCVKFDFGNRFHRQCHQEREVRVYTVQRSVVEESHSSFAWGDFARQYINALLCVGYLTRANILYTCASQSFFVIQCSTSNARRTIEAV